MTDPEKSKAYLLACFDAEVIDQPSILLDKRRAWRAGGELLSKSSPRATQEQTADAPETASAADYASLRTRINKREKNRSRNYSLIFFGAYMGFSLLRYLYRLVMSDGS